MTVLVLGSTGQVGRHLRDLLPNATFWGRDAADFADPTELEERVRRLSPTAIVNAAAYTAVDRAETEPQLAWRVNAEGPATLARAARSLDVPLVHISTDYVFDGEQTQPYRETDPTYPINVYGRTKLAGELAVASLWPKHWIFRASWLFSPYGANFVKTMVRLAAERDALRVIDDQHGRPTYAGDLARIIVAVVMERDPRNVLPFGLYHLGGGDPTTWHGFAIDILKRAHAIGLIDRMPSIEPIATAGYPTPARRPRYSVLAMNPEVVRVVGSTPDWHLGLEATFKALVESGRTK